MFHIYYCILYCFASFLVTASMPPRKQQRKRAATTTTGGPSSRRSRCPSTINATRVTQNAAPAVDLPPLATPRTSTPTAPSSGNVLSPEILQTLVSTVAAEVTRQMATMLPAQVPSPAVPAMATEPRPSQTSSSTAAVHSEVNNLVTAAIAAAHAGISGEPQLLPTIISPSTASSVEPTQLFHSAGLAIDSRDEEFIDFSSLLSNSANGNDKYQLSFLSSNGGLPASFCLEPAAKPKKILHIEAWLQAFHIFVGVYTQRYPVEARLNEIWANYSGLGGSRSELVLLRREFSFFKTNSTYSCSVGLDSRGTVVAFTLFYD